MSRAGTSGLRNWFLQRLSAVYIVVFILGTIIVWWGEPLSYVTWKAWVAHPLSNAGLLLFIGALLLHAWIGIRDVIIDYINPVGLRYTLLVLIAMTLLTLGVWAAKILLLVSLAI